MFHHLAAAAGSIAILANPCPSLAAAGRAGALGQSYTLRDEVLEATFGGDLGGVQFGQLTDLRRIGGSSVLDLSALPGEFGPPLLTCET